MKTYGYVRVSTETQAEDGNGLAVQQRMIEGRCLQDGVALDRVFVERGVSGGKPLADRPQGREMLSVLQSGDRVIAAKLDRAFRSASDALATLEALRLRRVDLYLLDLGGCVTSGGTSALIFGILASVAQFERGRIAQRVAESKAHSRQAGRYLGGRRPFGLRVIPGGGLEPDPAEQAAMATMLRLRGEGLSLRAIKAEVARLHGFRLSHVGVSRALEGARMAAVAGRASS